jgi:hypothetical protein
MGVFEYQCPRGHITEKFVPLADRPAHVDCEGGTEDVPCLHTAELVLSATPTTFRAMDRKAFKRSGH